MLIGLIGIRGTIPTAQSPTVSILVENEYLFDINPEFIYSFSIFREKWKTLNENGQLPRYIATTGTPSLAKIKHIFITHLHWDHWGGLRHLLHYLLLFEREKRENERLNIYIPQYSTIPLRIRLIGHLKLPETVQKKIPVDSAAYLRLMLMSEFGKRVTKYINIIALEPGEKIALKSNWTLYTQKTPHLPLGSLAYKLVYSKEKINLAKLKELNLPTHLIGEIRNNPTGVRYNNVLIKKSDLFTTLNLTFAYSGDSSLPTATDLWKFYQNVDVLIHDCSYLTAEEGYYLESHAALEELVSELNQRAINIRYLIPIHISNRHKLSEVAEYIARLKKEHLNFEIIVPSSFSWIFFNENHLEIIK